MRQVSEIRCLGDSLNKEQLLIEIEDIIRTMPPRPTIRHVIPENVAWFGRLSAAIEKWNSTKSALVKGNLDLFFSNGNARETAHGFTKLLMLLHQAQNDLRMETLGPTNVAIPHKMSFEYRSLNSRGRICCLSIRIWMRSSCLVICRMSQSVSRYVY